MSEEWFSDAALAKQAEFDRLRTDGEEIPLSIMEGLLEPRVPPTEDEKCCCCGTDARDETGGIEYEGKRWCLICEGREHHLK